MKESQSYRRKYHQTDALSIGVQIDHRATPKQGNHELVFGKFAAQKRTLDFSNALLYNQYRSKSDTKSDLPSVKNDY